MLTKLNRVAVGITLLWVPMAIAQSKTWTGAVDANWNTGGNWSPVGVPTASDTVLVGPGATAITFANANSVQSLDLRRQLNISGNVLLTVQGGGVSLNGGAIEIATATSSGAGGLSFLGGVQAINSAAPGATVRFVNNQGNRIVANNCALTIGANVVVETVGQGDILSSGTGSVTIAGTILANDGGSITLKSTTNYDLATKSLTGGTYVIGSSSGNFIRFTNESNSAQDIDVVGVGTTFVYGASTSGASLNSAIAGSSTIDVNLGTLEFRNTDDRSFTPPSGTLQNAGTIKLANASRMSIVGNFRNLAGGLVDMTFTGLDATLQQSRLDISGQAQLNNTGTLRLRISSVVPYDCGQLFEYMRHGSRVNGWNTVEVIPSSVTVTTLYNDAASGRFQITGSCQLQSLCDDIDFNNNSVFPEDQDVIDFFTVLAGGECN